MAYYDYLQRMLSPLGVYDLGENSLSGAVLASLGEALDEVCSFVAAGLQDAFPQRAGEEALSRWEGIGPVHPKPDTLARRQKALTFLLSRKGVSCSAVDAQQALAVCGIPAVVDESSNAPKITFLLSTGGLSQSQKADLNLLLRGIVPAHLQIRVQEESVEE